MTPRPSKPGSSASARWPLAGPNAFDASSCSEIEAGNAARTGKTPATSGICPSREIARGSSAAAKPSITRA